MTAVKLFFTNYAKFDGRSRRSEYWWPFLLVVIIETVLRAVSPVLYLIFVLAVIVPGIAIGIRRMHDIGKSGWFILIPIYNIILAATDSAPGDNQWGPNPKGVGGGLPQQDYGTPPPPPPPPTA